MTGIHNQNGIRHAVHLDELVLEECHVGQYVQDEIECYLGKKVVNLGNGHFTGVSVTYTDGKTYDFYTVPAANEKYITVMIGDRETREKLENYLNGVGTGVKLTGKIVRLPNGLNYPWFEPIFKTSSPDIINQKISPSYAIQQVDFQFEIQKIKEGISLLVLAAAIFAVCGGSRSSDDASDSSKSMESLYQQ